MGVLDKAPEVTGREHFRRGFIHLSLTKSLEEQAENQVLFGVTSRGKGRRMVRMIGRPATASTSQVTPRSLSDPPLTLDDHHLPDVITDKDEFEEVLNGCLSELLLENPFDVEDERDSFAVIRKAPLGEIFDNLCLVILDEVNTVIL